MSEKKNPSPLDILHEYNASHGDEKTPFETDAERVMMSRPQEVADAMATAMRGEDVSQIEPSVAEAAIEVMESMHAALDSVECVDRDSLNMPCEEKHCPVCGGHYKIMAFNHPGPCTELCRKEEAGDKWPSRSSFISSSE